MHPNAFLRTFWRNEYRPEVFVAMDFAPRYDDRYAQVIEPAIRGIKIGEMPLVPRRVDLSTSGDSILTQIVDGIAHSLLVLADVSVVGRDAETGKPIRNANVLYEVGVALACRDSSEVLLVRDDHEPFLFDVSTIPHKHINFNDKAVATQELLLELVSRLRERKKIRDARIGLAIATLTPRERHSLNEFKKFPLEQVFFVNQTDVFSEQTVARLLDKQLIRSVAVTEKNQIVLKWTEIGYHVANEVNALLPEVPVEDCEEPATAPQQLDDSR